MNNYRFTDLISKLTDFVQKTFIYYILIDVTGFIWDCDFLYNHLLKVQGVLQLLRNELHVIGLSPATDTKVIQSQEDNYQLKTHSSVQRAMQRLLVAKDQKSVVNGLSVGLLIPYIGLFFKQFTSI